MLEKIGTKEDRKEAILKRARGAWDLIFGLLEIEITTEPIDIAALSDADHPTTQAVFQILSLEFWLFTEINKASRGKNSSKIQSLGPFAALLAAAMDNAQRSRKDSRLGHETLYKPLSLPKS